MIKNEKPIIIIGAERSGTTLLYSLLANHPDLYWFSRLDSVFPQAPAFCTIIRRGVNFVKPNENYIAVKDKISRTQGLIPPSECLPYWRRFFSFVDETDETDLGDDYYDAQDLNEDTNDFILSDINLRIRLLDKKRLLLKQPAFSLKIGYFNKLFPDALFVHVIRHPMSNYESLLKAKRNSGKIYWGSKFPGWREYRDVDLQLQAGMHLKNILEIIARDIRAFEGLINRYIQIRYEELVSRPMETINKVMTYSDLRMSPSLEQAIYRISRNNEFRNPNQMIPANVKKILAPLVSEYGYDSYHINKV